MAVKLVRDRTPLPSWLTQRQVKDADEYLDLLVEKAREDFARVLDNGGRDVGAFAELAETLASLGACNSIYESDVVAARATQIAEFGGLEDGTVHERPSSPPRGGRLAMRWSAKECDFVIDFPAKGDGHLLHHAFSGARAGSRMGEFLGIGWGPSLLEELRGRGYDLTTLRFSVRRPGLDGESEESTTSP